MERMAATGILVPLRHLSHGMAIMVLALLPALSGAQVYRSVDESGNVIFSDSPPENAVEVEPVEIRPGPTTDQVRESQERVDATREQLHAMRAALEAEEKKRHEERMRRLEEQAARAAANPSQGQASANDPDARAWWRHYGRPVTPQPRPPSNRPRPRQPGGGDHPSFRPRPIGR